MIATLRLPRWNITENDLFLFNRPIFPKLLQAAWVPKSKFLLIVGEAVILQAGSSCHHSNNGFLAPNSKWNTTETRALATTEPNWVTYDEECSSALAHQQSVVDSVVGSAWHQFVLDPRAAPVLSWDRWCYVRPVHVKPAAAAAAVLTALGDADELQASLIIQTVPAATLEQYRQPGVGWKRAWQCCNFYFWFSLLCWNYFQSGLVSKKLLQARCPSC